MLADLTDILQVLRDAETYLASRGVPNARRNADWLLAHVLNCRSPELYLTPYRVLDRSELDLFDSMVRRRGEREPLQYILGSTEFMSLPFRTRRGVFIPRPETELLVERVEVLLSTLRKGPPGERPGSGLTVLDLCCGTGVIGIALVSRLPFCRCVSVDSGSDAVALARENSVMNGVGERVESVESDAAEFLRLDEAVYDAVVCNPPYVPTGEIGGLLPEVRDHEPLSGLDGGADGLTFYRELLPLISRVTSPGGIVAFEIGDAQGEAVATLFESVSLTGISVHKDYRDLDRVVIARRP